MLKPLNYHLSALFLWLVGTLPATAAVLVKDKMWPKNSTLTVAFLDGSPAQKQLVKQYAPLWVEGSSLQLKFVEQFPPPQGSRQHTHIRISFQAYTGSQLGNHGDYLSQSPTLLLNKLNQLELTSASAKRFVLHEFGHALGFEHEYRNPKWPFGDYPIQQQIEACQPRLQKLDYAVNEAKQKCVEINRPLQKARVNSTIYDEYSIMNYPQLIQLNDNSFKQIDATTQLSALDKMAMQIWYGK